ncbi:HAD family hydrolase [Paenibacillus sp. CGMCC 1.16610]|uniref:HAD-IA family hydrolase n=1 Tax=Paenibacillus anseongense TaxID=2682845 RepID=A0ABW9UEC5_9BACL|nr:MULTISPECIES: HAD family hydrolase [Paenibacillus]MBA2937133.1 HAD family hydrolase [Paenibacillus sp. CGMCC 1.16610]MVQ36195.1 HAD-IA family hydrolase [Paenibacillus anseongense]
MTIKAVFLDFYGTLVHEDDEIIPDICEQIKSSSESICEIDEIGKFWWNVFSDAFRNSYGDTFQTQRTLGISSLSHTVQNYNSSCVAEEIIKAQFEHWQRPKIYEDTNPFIQSLHGITTLILSNIDTEDIMEAIKYHDIHVNAVLTSEDVKSYKPNPELFQEALQRFDLNPNEVIHIGDSFLSDVNGAKNLGITAIWLNRLNKKKPDGIDPDYICKDLYEVRNILEILLR